MDDGARAALEGTLGKLTILVAAVSASMAVCTPRATAAGPDPSANPEIKTYCSNIAAAATDARFAWQTRNLNELETRIRSRIQDLDAKEAELRSWMEKREAVEKKAGEKLVGIYAKMRPETAATQLSNLDDTMAAAVLGQLNPRQASAIFNEIVPERAAKLAGMIAGAAAPDDKKL